MAKAPSWKYPVLRLIKQDLLSFACELSELRGSKRFLLKALRKRNLLFFLGGAIALWQWQLLLAAGIGLLSTGLIYKIQQRGWQLPWASIRRLWDSANRQLILAVTAGGVTTLGAYLAIEVWIDSKNPWIATGAILQGCGTLAVLILLIWQMAERHSSSSDLQFNQLVLDLTHSDPLKRLIAVRQLTQSAQARPDKTRNMMIAEYFQLMLSRELEVVVQNAILDGLEVVGASQLNSADSPAWLINPAKAKTVPSSH